MRLHLLNIKRYLVEELEQQDLRGDAGNAVHQLGVVQQDWNRQLNFFPGQLQLRLLAEEVLQFALEERRLFRDIGYKRNVTKRATSKQCNTPQTFGPTHLRHVMYTKKQALFLRS